MSNAEKRRKPWVFRLLNLSYNLDSRTEKRHHHLFNIIYLSIFFSKKNWMYIDIASLGKIASGSQMVLSRTAVRRLCCHSSQAATQPTWEVVYQPPKILDPYWMIAIVIFIIMSRIILHLFFKQWYHNEQENG